MLKPLHKSNSLQGLFNETHIDYTLLCSKFFITRETVERLFKYWLGLRPFKYIYFYRLKCINSILLTSYDTKLSLNELALSYNIRHYGMFGESPKKRC